MAESVQCKGFFPTPCNKKNYTPLAKGSIVGSAEPGKICENLNIVCRLLFAIEAFCPSGLVQIGGFLHLRQRREKWGLEKFIDILFINYTFLVAISFLILY